MYADHLRSCSSNKSRERCRIWLSCEDWIVLYSVEPRACLTSWSWHHQLWKNCCHPWIMIDVWWKWKDWSCQEQSLVESLIFIVVNPFFSSENNLNGMKYNHERMPMNNNWFRTLDCLVDLDNSLGRSIRSDNHTFHWSSSSSHLTMRLDAFQGTVGRLSRRNR
jgi:hypothetical protein